MAAMLMGPFIHLQYALYRGQSRTGAGDYLRNTVREAKIYPG